MKIITYATDYNHSNIKFLQNKLSIELVPNYTSWDNNFYAKAYDIYRFIKQYSNNELVMCVDAYDVLPLNGCDNYILEKLVYNYFDLERITFNAETGCYPSGSIAGLYPNHHSKWKYLNAGIFVGKNIYIQRMYELVLDNIKNSMDQLQFSLLFLNNPKLINLDYNCQIFQTLYNGRIRGDIDNEDFIFDLDNKIVYNKCFNTKPLLFHGNGKINMSKLHPYV